MALLRNRPDFASVRDLTAPLLRHIGRCNKDNGLKDKVLQCQT